ncbi:hypothetical protein EDE05_1243 [Neorhizobium sp. R1-B]|jgi:hypothetical protein|uniref:hypothetical protein n=1 Tax=Neorhizobium TaxID=1525371 RepID=UPI0010E5B242|nr:MULTISPECIES: hypothetical protein [Neorhizobium]TCV60915.1 hypothetical protein EDE09_12760 [Neorhizobium sp. S3-V5DH]TDX73799.1 hypothetical protein EDE05_1243 [Neorhizobium sp. R1-B]
MRTTTIRYLGMLAVIATTLGGASQALSQGFELYIDRDGPRYNDDRYRERRYYDEDYRDRRYYRPRSERSGCSVGEAMRKASRYLDDPQPGKTSNRSIEIRGYGSRGERNRVIFANRPGCPRIG